MTDAIASSGDFRPISLCTYDRLELGQICSMIQCALWPSDLRSYLFESQRERRVCNYARSCVRKSEATEHSEGASEGGLYWYSNRSKCSRWNTIDVDKVMKDV